eukprot:m.118329 g.118329  ORF g.118329 m.118329 type:complete len:435 (+) comp13652_c1_seq2:310-1614(+)
MAKRKAPRPLSLPTLHQLPAAEEQLLGHNADLTPHIDLVTADVTRHGGQTHQLPGEVADAMTFNSPREHDAEAVMPLFWGRNKVFRGVFNVPARLRVEVLSGQLDIHDDQADGRDMKIEVAVKMTNLYPSLKMTNDMIVEANILCEVRHPNVVRCFGIYSTPQQTGVVTQLANHPCTTLDVLLEDLRQGKQGWTKGNLFDVVVGLTRGMREIHMHKICHRDLKADNILLRLSSTGQLIPQICDFGSAFHIDKMESRITTSHERFEAPYTMRVSEHDMRFDDVYKLALVLWSVFTYEIPFFTRNVDEFLEAPAVFAYHVQKGLRPPLPPTLPTRITRLITCLWAAAPQDRYPRKDDEALPSTVVSMPVSPLDILTRTPSCEVYEACDPLLATEKLLTSALLDEECFFPADEAAQPYEFGAYCLATQSEEAPARAD